MTAMACNMTSEPAAAPKADSTEQSARERGRALRLAGRLDEAVKVLRSAPADEMGDSRLHEELGAALSEMNRHEEAIGAFLAALQRTPDSSEICGKLGATFYARGLFRPAVDWLQRWHELNPADATYLYQLGKSLVSIGCFRSAAEVFEQLVRAEPDNAIARHMALATLGSREPSKASAEYVCALFDGCADRFDETLARLVYRGPEIVRATLEKVGLLDGGKRDILDVGCGTGLVGAALRSYARRLVGVDLSAGMLELAHQRQVYDQLIETEVVEFMRSITGEFDIISASDVLTYFGDVSEFFSAAAGALRPGGAVVVVVESLAGGSAERTYRLNPTGRFSHSSPYLRQMIENAGLKVEILDEDVMRREADKPVPTLVAVGRLWRETP